MRSLKVAVAAALVVLSASPASAEAVNSPPVVVNDAVSYRNISIERSVAVLANDSDSDGDQLVVTAVSPASQGTAYLRDGTVMYKPWPGSAGTDSFTYTVSDGQANTATGTVTVTLWADPSAPSDLTIGPADATSATLH